MVHVLYCILWGATVSKQSLTTNMKQLLGHLHVVLFVLVTTMTTFGSCQVDMSKALIWSTTAPDGSGAVTLLYGDPKIYVPQLVQNYSERASFDMRNDIRAEGKRYRVLETHYARSTLYFSTDDFIEYFHNSLPRLSSSYSIKCNIPTISNEVTGFSFDWTSRLLYWSDAGYQRICHATTEYYSNYGSPQIRHWRVIVDTNLTSPQDVAVYPHKGYLFWSDLGVNPKIERLDLSNDERRILVSNPTLSQPKTLCIDFVNRRLYWLDTGRAGIGFINIDGSGLTLWPASSFFSTISSFVIYENYIFLGTKEKSVVHIYDVNQQLYLTNITTVGRREIIDITMWSRERQPNISSPCTADNGGCNHFCITANSTSRRCFCAMGFHLEPDESTCLPKISEVNKFLLIADENQQNIFQIDVDNGEVRATQSRRQSPVTAMDFDPVCKCLYWFDSEYKNVMKTSLVTGLSDVLIYFNVRGIEVASLAFDKVSRTLIYVDYRNESIGQIFIDRKSTRVLLRQSGSHPRAVCLDSFNRLMYWTDCERMSIDRGFITNTNINRSSVVTGLGGCATAITIDLEGESLYWGDHHGVIETVNLDGTGRRMMHEDRNAIYTGLALDSTYLYIADPNKRQIQRLNRMTLQITNLTKMVFTKPYAIVFYTNETGKRRKSPVNTEAPDSNSNSISTGKIHQTSASTHADFTSTLILTLIPCISVVIVVITVTIGVVCVKRNRRMYIRTGPSIPIPTDQSGSAGRSGNSENDYGNQMFSYSQLVQKQDDQQHDALQ